MKIDRTIPLLVCLAAFSTPCVFALPSSNGISSDPLTDPKLVSSSALPDAPDADQIAAGSANRVHSSLVRSLRLGTRPFSTVAVSITGGIGGLGLDLATPIATKMNLHASTSFFNFNGSITEDGIPINAAIKLRSIGAGVDFFPYHNTFHITPGVTIYNGTHATATANIAPGSSFTLNDDEYTSVATDPVSGTFAVDFGRRLAPSLTMGFGNMLRRDSHWTIPVDFGFQYIGQPKVSLNLAGSVCDSSGDCGTIANDPTTMANIAAEQAEISKDISPLRFYPILKIGLSYRFGRNVKREYWY